MGIFSSNQVKSNHNCLFPWPNPFCSALPALAPTPSLPPHYIHPPRSLWRGSITPVHRLRCCSSWRGFRLLSCTLKALPPLLLPGCWAGSAASTCLTPLLSPQLQLSDWDGKGQPHTESLMRTRADTHSKAFGNQVAALCI